MIKMVSPTQAEIEVPLLAEIFRNRDGLKTEDAYKKLETYFTLTKADLEEKVSSGQLKFANTILWASNKLKENGEIVKTERGLWTITPKGVERLTREKPEIVSERRTSQSSVDAATVSEERDVDAEYKKYRASNQIEFITFHPSYAYEDFIEGIRPQLINSEKLVYELKDGAFKEISKRALRSALMDNGENIAETSKMGDLIAAYNRKINEGISKTSFWKNVKTKYVLIIDEINRGDIPKIFGELITLIEDDKRLGGDHELTVRLPYSREEFGVPINLYIIGTMNTADKSISLIDVALRRRFEFNEMPPKIIEEFIKDSDTRNAVTRLNALIRNEDELGKDKQVGHAYFMKKTDLDMPSVWTKKIFPLMEEYLYYNPRKLHEWFADYYDENGQRNGEEPNSKTILEHLPALPKM